MVSGWSRFDERGLGEILYAPRAYSRQTDTLEQCVYDRFTVPARPISGGKKRTGPRLAVMAAAVLSIAAAWLLAARAPGFDEAEAAVPAVAVESAAAREDCYSVLLVGRDASGANTDTLMLCFYDADNGVFNIVSISRDTLVNVSWGVKKINSVAAREGMDGLLDAVEGLFGFRPNDWVAADLDLFEALIDELGGVRFNVPVDMNYDDPSQDLSIHYKAGEQLLDGHDALCVFRYRQNSDGTGYLRGDLDRIDTQHALLGAVADRVFSAKTLLDLNGVAALVAQKTKTSLSAADILRWGAALFRAGRQAIRFYTMPVQDITAGRLRYVSPVLDAWVQMLNDSFRYYEQPVRAGDLRIYTMAADGTLCMTDGSEPTTNFY